MAIPSHWTRTSRKPVMIDDYEWLSYRTGINRYALYCVQMDAVVSANYNYNGYSAMVNTMTIMAKSGKKAHRYATEAAACRGAIKAFNK